MKKLLLSLAALAAVSTVNAQDIKLLLNDDVQAVGSTVYWNVIDLEEGQIKPPLYILSADGCEDASVRANCVSGQTISLCCGGHCSNGTDVTKDGLTLLANTKLPLDLEYMDFMADTAEDFPKNINIALTVTNNETEEVSNYTVMLNSESGIKIVAADREAYVAGSNLYYNVAAASKAMVYDLNGRVLLNATVNGAGSIDLSILPGGVYVYSVNGVTGKIIK